MSPALSGHCAIVGVGNTADPRGTERTPLALHLERLRVVRGAARRRALRRRLLPQHLTGRSRKYVAKGNKSREK